MLGVGFSVQDLGSGCFWVQGLGNNILGVLQKWVPKGPQGCQGIIRSSWGFLLGIV